MITYIISILSAAAIIAADRLTKLAASRHIAPVGRVPLIDGVFSLTYLENTGAAFGILKGARWFFVPLTVAVIAVIAVYFARLPRRGRLLAKISLIMICGGAVGNLIDRAWTGRVIDFLYFELIDFPVFNVADISLVCGAILFAAETLFGGGSKAAAS
ncbi:MAG: signal peptidase II [Clostridiales bacterium]|jgi:signal peptidase II|nr:signal peptidase II [Clostridiales bacterium]